MARITTIIITSALVIDFILLPSLLILVSPNKVKKKSDNPDELIPDIVINK